MTINDSLVVEDTYNDRRGRDFSWDVALKSATTPVVLVTDFQLGPLVAPTGFVTPPGKVDVGSGQPGTLVLVQRSEVLGLVQVNYNGCMDADKPGFLSIPAGAAGPLFAPWPYIFATEIPLRYIFADGITVY